MCSIQPSARSSQIISTFFPVSKYSFSYKPDIEQLKMLSRVYHNSKKVFRPHLRSNYDVIRIVGCLFTPEQSNSILSFKNTQIYRIGDHQIYQFLPPVHGLGSGRSFRKTSFPISWLPLVFSWFVALSSHFWLDVRMTKPTTSARVSRRRRSWIVITITCLLPLFAWTSSIPLKPFEELPFVFLLSRFPAAKIQSDCSYCRSQQSPQPHPK